jgi:hypothetical protein
MVATSAVVIAACILLISLSLAAFVQTWDPCSFVAGTVLLPLPLAVAICQYLGVFRRHAKSAGTAAILLFIVGGFAWFGFFTTMGEAIADGMELPWVALLLPMAATGTVCIFVGWMNLRWRRKIRSSVSAVRGENRSKPLLQFSMRELLASVAMLAAVVGLTTYFVRSTPPRYAEHVDRSEAPFGLPDGATDVCYCQGFRGTIAYEFTIDEQGFRDWVESGIGSLESQAAKVQIQPIQGGHVIYRYYHFAPDLQGPDQATVTQGLYYSWAKEDRGVHAVFDRSSNRAYYFAHSH